MNVQSLGLDLFSGHFMPGLTGTEIMKYFFGQSQLTTSERTT